MSRQAFATIMLPFLGDLFMQLRRFAGVLALGLAPFISTAQQAVPLSTELFEMPWWIVEFEGAREDLPSEPSTLIVTDMAAGDVAGDSPCGNAWLAKIKLDLPKVTFSDVEGYYDQSCPGYKNMIALLNAFEQVSHATTSPDGLEFRAADNRRVMLLVAGG
jgi:hypothetical protein